MFALVFAAHDVGWSTPYVKLGLHKVHVGGDVGEKLAVAAAEVVQAGLVVAVG